MPLRLHRCFSTCAVLPPCNKSSVRFLTPGLAARRWIHSPSMRCFGPLQAAQQTFMADLWRDAVGFMGAVMVRRIVGIAHVAEMKTIDDPDVRCGGTMFFNVLQG